jgi:hypothetical protein
MAVDEAVLNKIKKLLALAGENGFTNDNENEANAAFKKAAALMEKHGLAIADVNSETGEVTDIQNVVIRQGQGKYKVWANQLAAILAKCFDCKVILIGADNQAFIGTKSDVGLCIWYYNFLKIRIARGASTKFHYVKDQKTYGLGCVSALRQRLYDMYLKAQEEVRSEQTKALVVVKNQEVEKRYNELYPNARKTQARKFSMGSSSAFHAGLRDGSKMTINQPIE